MNEQIECVTKILTSIENIETLIHSNEVPLGEHVQEAINEYVSGLKELNEVGSHSNFPISFDLLKFLDGDISNPWLYMHKQLEECEKEASILGKRKQHLEKIQETMKSEINS